MEEKPKKKWYKTKIGIFFIILFFPIAFFVFLIALFIKAHKLIWKQNWKTPYRLAAIFGLWLLLFISPAFASPSKTQTLGASTVSTDTTPKVTVGVTVDPTTQVTLKPTVTKIPTLAPKPTPTSVPTYTPIPTRVYIAPTHVYIPPTAVPVQQTSGNLDNNNHYTNSAGNEVHSPANTTDNSVPAGASARCGDGSYSFSQSRSGTCSHHGGVAQWL